MLFTTCSLSCFFTLVKILRHNVTTVRGHCNIQFHIDISWNEFEHDKDTEVVIDLSDQTVVQRIHRLFLSGNTTSLAKKLSGKISDLTPNTLYNWTVFFSYDNERIIQIGSGFFNTSENCMHKAGMCRCNSCKYHSYDSCYFCRIFYQCPS